MENKLTRAAPFVFLPLILLNTIFSQRLLLGVFSSNYTYIYLPVFWLVLAVASFFLLRKKHYRQKVRKDVLFWVIVAAVIYLILRFFAGIFEGFGYSPYDTSFLGILRNIFSFVFLPVCREFVRAALVASCKPGKTRTKVICVLTTAVLAFSELNFERLLNSFSTPFGIFEQFGGYLMPALVVSAMLTLVALHAGFLPGVIYQASTLILFYVLPVLPDSTWLTISLLGSLVPFIFAIIINYSIGLSNHTMTRRDMRDDKPASWITTFVILMVFVLFITGVLPYYPVAIATGSMEPNIMTGDMVVIDKTDRTRSSLDIGDVIQYKRGNFTVVHRIIGKRDVDGDMYFTTKGDNNDSPDSGEVPESRVVGKVMFRVRYLGYLTLWMNSQNVDDQSENVDVETGGHNNG